MITERAALGMFYERLQQSTGQNFIDLISTPVIRSDQDSESYPSLGMVPQMSEKKGDKKFSELREIPWTVNNVEYQGGIKLPKNWVLYDKTGQVRSRVNEMAERSMAHWVSIIAPLIVAGEAALCYDDQYFFDVDHSTGDSGAQSNDISASAAAPTAPTATEMIDAILGNVQQILGFKDDRGEYVNENMTDFLVLTGTTLMKPALKALGQSLVGGGDTNILLEQDSYRLRVVASPRFNSWTTKFAVFSTQGEQKPIIRQQRMPNQEGFGYDVNGMLTQMLWTDSEHFKLNDECLISVETERAAAYGDWKKACLTTFA